MKLIFSVKIWHDIQCDNLFLIVSHSYSVRVSISLFAESCSLALPESKIFFPLLSLTIIIMMVFLFPRESLKNIEDYTSVAIKLPELGNSVTVLKYLLVNTSCRVKEKKVNWSKLCLSTIDESWLFHIKSWVQFLNLSHNTLTSLPECLIDLKMVVSLNLSKNKLKVVPIELFSMISLRDLNLSGNGIAELPEIPQWRPVLKTLNVSDNNLSSLPDGIGRSYMETLNLSRNHFTRVPLAVCDIISLRDLDLSDNREINHLPDEMGKLRNLSHINLKNLDQVSF